mmetsp:Transcript_20209/g.29016  ORF Transcript_20209/g.29016 Transcript_20209/m.29016 type:complete len:1153 (+) Transcript_20209:94-3552(+)
MNVTSALGWVLGSQAPSGAIDMVVVRKADGTMSCSPFHVKLPVGRKNTGNKLVKIRVNGKDVKLSMKLGTAGEAFFVERTKQHEFVIKRLRASPPTSPVRKTLQTSEQAVRGCLSDSMDEIEPIDSEKKNENLEKSVVPLQIRRTLSENDLEMATSRVDIDSLCQTQPPTSESPPTLCLESTDSLPTSACESGQEQMLRRRSFTTGHESAEEFYSLQPPKSLSKSFVGGEDQEKVGDVYDHGIETVLPESEERGDKVSGGWTWTWGDLPIKSTDPSIAEFFSLTDIALREKRRAADRVNSLTSSIGSPEVNENVSLSPADGKAGAKQHGCSVWNSEFRDIPPECVGLGGDSSGTKDYVTSNSSSFAIDNTLPSSETSFPNPVTTESFGSDVSLHPEPKHHTHPILEIPESNRRPVTDSNMSDCREPASSPTNKVADTSNCAPDSQPPPLLQRTLSHTISSRAAAVASALGSDRTLSLCAHILSSENAPHTAEDLRKVIDIHAVSPEEFSSSALDILNNPNLVVVANNILIPWRLVHEHLTRSSRGQTGGDEEGGVESSSNGLLWWAGKSVITWGNSGCIPTDTGTINEEGAVDITHASPTMESRRSSYRSGEDDDFGLMECLSESSSCQGDSESLTNGRHSFSTDDNSECAHLNIWSKEQLDWNSVDDFQRLLSECTRADSVPDLLKPYVTNQAAWVEDMDNSTSSLATDDHPAVGIEVASKGGRVETLPTSPINSSVSASRSHDTGLNQLSQLAQAGSPPQIDFDINNHRRKISTEAPGKDAEDLVRMNSLALSDTDPTSMDIGVTEEGSTTGDDGTEGVDFLSLHDISADDILPGPARGDVYDGSDTDSFYSLSLEEGEGGAQSLYGSAQAGTGRVLPRKYLYRKTLVPNQEQIKAMDLQDGENEISFEVEGNIVSARLFVWPEDAKVVVADIEGAIFVSNSGSGGGALGLVMSLWGSTSARRETHEGLSQLFDSIAANGYRFLYIATKPDTSQKDQLLKSSGGGSDPGLPAGPVFLPPDALIQAFGAERTDLFKAAALRGVRSLFPSQHNPYHAAFGAHARDVLAFDRCDIPLGRTFLVNEKGEITTMTTVTLKRTYTEMNSLLHQIFPAVTDAFSRKRQSTSTKLSAPVTEDTYGDFNFWRLPPPPIL